MDPMPATVSGELYAKCGRTLVARSGRGTDPDPNRLDARMGRDFYGPVDRGRLLRKWNTSTWRSDTVSQMAISAILFCDLLQGWYRGQPTWFRRLFRQWRQS